MKLARHEKIIELIKEYDIDTQEELAARLNEAGFKVTQATVSRDIRALKMTKVAGKDGKSRYAILQDTQPGLGDQYTRVLNDAVVSIEVGQNLVCLLYTSGMNILETSKKVQEKVKAAIENMTGLEVADVNIHIASVDMENEKSK